MLPFHRRAKWHLGFSAQAARLSRAAKSRRKAASRFKPSRRMH